LQFIRTVCDLPAGDPREHVPDVGESEFPVFDELAHQRDPVKIVTREQPVLRLAPLGDDQSHPLVHPERGDGDPQNVRRFPDRVDSIVWHTHPFCPDTEGMPQKYDKFKQKLRSLMLHLPTIENQDCTTFAKIGMAWNNVVVVCIRGYWYVNKAVPSQ
jgi:hypothetical protein